MSKFETLRNHKIATGLVILFGGIGLMNSVEPVRNEASDRLEGGGDFVGGRYLPAIYYVQPTPNNDGGFFESDKEAYAEKTYECAGKLLVLKTFKAHYQPDTPDTDPNAIQSIELVNEQPIPGPSPECADNTLTDTDAKFHFWRKNDHFILGPDFLKKVTPNIDL